VGTAAATAARSQISTGTDHHLLTGQPLLLVLIAASKPVLVWCRKQLAHSMNVSFHLVADLAAGKAIPVSVSFVLHKQGWSPRDDVTSRLAATGTAPVGSAGRKLGQISGSISKGSSGYRLTLTDTAHNGPLTSYLKGGGYTVVLQERVRLTAIIVTNTAATSCGRHGIPFSMNALTTLFHLMQRRCRQLLLHMYSCIGGQ
jgi:hypothetical protein